MNYGYDSTCANWKEERKHLLSVRLCAKLNIPLGHSVDTPYIEVDRLYRGVRIRRITHLTAEARRTLVKKADEIYNEVMNQ